MRNLPFIIAEAGVNHQGSEKMAMQLVDVAHQAGADCVKFQTFKAQSLVDKSAQLADYQKRQLSNDVVNQYELLKSLELSFDSFRRIKTYCDRIGIEFLSTAFDEVSLDFLVSIGIKRIKIPSGELTNLPFLRKAASYNVPVIISTGMASLDEVQASMNALLLAGVHKESITILHCTTEYPAPLDEVNLLAMDVIKKQTGCAVGYSDHTEGNLASILAVAKGATIIEKHFTLDKNLPGPDHKASMNPSQLVALVKDIRLSVSILGRDIKEATPSELKNKIIARKSIFFSRQLKQGDVVTQNDLTMKRPGDGVSPMEVDRVVGKKTVRDIAEGTKFQWDLIE